jgi:hypothetical protein
MLLDREAVDFGPFSATTIPELEARSVVPEKLVLDHQRSIAGPTADPNEILICGNRAVDQHHRTRRVAVLIDESPSEVEQHDDEVLNVIERTNCRLKDFRAIATRYDKLARNFLAGLCLVTALLYWCD